MYSTNMVGPPETTGGEIGRGDGLLSPFGELGLSFSEPELHETAYEVLVACSRSSGSGKPLTFSGRGEKGLLTSSPVVAFSKVKKGLGLKSKKKDLVGLGKKSSSIGELIRVQMRVSEQIDSRVRRALLRVAAGLLGRRIESIILPLELLQQLRPSEFSNQRDYDVWQRRNLKVLEVGLLVHPHLPLDKKDTAPQQLREIIRGAQKKSLETGKHSEPMQLLRRVVLSLACRSFDGSADTCHWADGIPLNLRLYEILLESCFDVNEKSSVIEEVDELLELIKKTWVVLGISQAFHNLCFLWVLFNRYVATDQVEGDLLLAVNNMLVEVEKDAKAAKDPSYVKILSSTLSMILSWAETRLFSYHDAFYRGTLDAMENVLSLGVSTATILVENISYEYHKKGKEIDVQRSRVDSYIRSSVRNAYSQEREKLISSRKSFKKQQSPLPTLCVLAQSLSDVAFNEGEIYSPLLKRWHPLATGVAVATLHACYGKELKQFISGISELTPDAIQVLISADKLEKDLVQMAVADSVESEDGGKEIIQEMAPYEAEAVIARLVKSWIITRVERLKEWVERNLQQEVWNPQANRERVAPSAIEVLRIVDETLEAFFLLPIPMHPVLLPDLISGIDRCLQNYISKAKSGCGSRSSFLPVMPVLTRCSRSSKFSVFRKKDGANIVQGRKSQVGTSDRDDSFSIPRLCVRINTFYHIQKQLEILMQRSTSHLKTSGCVHDDDLTRGLGKKLELSTAACVEGIQHLSETTAYKVIFHDLSHVLWDYLYVGDVSSSRIDPFLDELEQHLEIISSTVHDRVRTRVITCVMKAAFEGFLLVLLAGGPSRAFTMRDASIIDEDLKFLKDLFWSNGDGLPTDLIKKSSVTLEDVLALFHTDTGSLVEQYKQIVLDSYGASAKSRLPLPATTGQWKRTEPNTVLRVLCLRNDETASKFLKKTYNLPKRL
ncbi:hypothetical protein Leryth_012863 [Lithospermum erythrorhizon]|nr:hypothetical protein Leryth_012863 [Lithospermum erythrorhizon]